MSRKAMISGSEEESEEEQEEYEVERIVSHRIRHGIIMYYVKWAGYEDKDNTWEPQDNLGNAVEKVAEYWDEHEERIKEVQKKFGRKTGAAMVNYPRRWASGDREGQKNNDDNEEYVPNKEEDKKRRREDRELAENVWRDRRDYYERVPENAVPAEMVPQLAALLPPAVPAQVPAKPVSAPRAIRNAEAPRVARIILPSHLSRQQQRQRQQLDFPGLGIWVNGRCVPISSVPREVQTDIVRNDEVGLAVPEERQVTADEDGLAFPEVSIEIDLSMPVQIVSSTEMTTPPADDETIVYI